MLRQATSVGSTEAVFHAITKEHLIANDTQLAIEDRLTRNKTRRFWPGGFDRIRGYWLGVRRDIATIGRDQKSHDQAASREFVWLVEGEPIRSSAALRELSVRLFGRSLIKQSGPRLLLAGKIPVATPRFQECSQPTSAAEAHVQNDSTAQPNRHMACSCSEPCTMIERRFLRLPAPWERLHPRSSTSIWSFCRIKRRLS